eukprot:TRINITY_DN33757_c0_g1_i1.p1 TRINITY_DN33757_c0_g1~~TRINITY_DN33757_c0_g1_i1.p1  ORF type:complete len:285 (+),score=62.17 TRINITY_DN33757_c0_g1_i1:109-963(+)
MFSQGEQPQDARTPSWLGLQFASNEDKNIVRNVLVAAACIAGLQFIGFVAQVAMSQKLAGASFHFMLGLALPACGYYGAKTSNRNFMACFCGCNWCQVCGSSMVIVLCLGTFMETAAKGSPLCAHICLLTEHAVNVSVPVGMPLDAAPASSRQGALGLPPDLRLESSKKVSEEELPEALLKEPSRRTYADDQALAPSDMHMVKEPAEEIDVNCKDGRAAEEVRAKCNAAIQKLMGLLALLGIPQVLLSAFAGWYGLELWNRLGRGEAITQHRIDTAQNAGEDLE